MKKIILISKDAVSKDYLPVYGNKFWKTPNIDELAKKGTVFYNHYTVAASTAMAFYSMITGEHCYQTKCRDYGEEEQFFGETIFDKFKKEQYQTFLVWDESYTDFAKKHLKIVFDKTEIISLNILPKIPPHIVGTFDDLSFDNKASQMALTDIYESLKKISEINDSVFVWIHLPHVLAGRNSYCSDIDLFDNVVGFGRELFGDDSVFISADHGNMDGKNGKYGYGFDVDEPAISIPLITPKINSQHEVHINTCNIDLFELLNLKIPEEKYIVTDTAYYCQPKRKISIIKDNYKLVYCKEKGSFQLFDLDWDPNEKYNLFYPEFYDSDRLTWYSLNQRFYYPYWDKAEKAKKDLLKKYNEIWRNGPFLVEKEKLVKLKLKYLYLSMKKKSKTKTIINIGK